MSKADSSTAGLTIIELLVVMAILAVLVGVGVPALSSSRESAARSQCAANLRTLTSALQAYAADNSGMFPVSDQGARQPSNWLVALFNGNYITVENSKRPFAANRGKSCLYCPSAVRVAPPTGGNWNTYAMNVFAGGWYQTAGTASASRNVRVTRPAETALIMDGCRIDKDYYVTSVGREGWFPELVHPGKLFGKTSHPDRGANVGFIDGHVEFRKAAELPTDTTNVFWSGQ